jgi:hypothetical protein
MSINICFRRWRPTWGFYVPHSPPIINIYRHMRYIKSSGRSSPPIINIYRHMIMRWRPTRGFYVPHMSINICFRRWRPTWGFYVRRIWRRGRICWIFYEWLSWPLHLGQVWQIFYLMYHQYFVNCHFFLLLFEVYY